LKRSNMKHSLRIVITCALGIAAALLPAVAVMAQQPREDAREMKRPARAFVWKSAGRGYLGVEVMGLTAELREHFGAPEDAGVLVSRVVEKGPAATAGIQVGDVLTSVDGEPVVRPQSLARAVGRKKEGETVVVELQRDRAPLSLTVSVSERDRPMIDLGDMYFETEIPELPAIPYPPEAGVFIGSPGLHLDEEAMKAFEESMRELKGRFDSDEWREKLKRIQEIDLSKVQERMKEVEERLKKLEEELQSEATKKKLDD
jgi:membrane-associated protease RseP (regulator of RpoE activity)